MEQDMPLCYANSMLVHDLFAPFSFTGLYKHVAGAAIPPRVDCLRDCSPVPINGAFDSVAVEPVFADHVLCFCYCWFLHLRPHSGWQMLGLLHAMELVKGGVRDALTRRKGGDECTLLLFGKGGGGRPAVRGKGTYGGRPGQREEQGTWASRTRKHSEAGYGRPVDRGAWTAKTVKQPPQQPAQPQYANYWAPLTRTRHGTSRHIQHSPGTPTTGLRERGNDTSRSTGRSGRQNAATRRNMRRDERVTVQGPVKKQQPDGMSHEGGMTPAI